MVWQRHGIRLRLSALAPAPSEVGDDILVSERSSRSKVRSAARDRVEDMQAVLDILDRAVIRKLVEELPHELLGRDRRHRCKLAWTIQNMARWERCDHAR